MNEDSDASRAPSAREPDAKAEPLRCYRPDCAAYIGWKDGKTYCDEGEKCWCAVMD